jgi:hypothetical protein
MFGESNRGKAYTNTQRGAESQISSRPSIRANAFRLVGTGKRNDAG